MLKYQLDSCVKPIKDCGNCFVILGGVQPNIYIKLESDRSKCVKLDKNGNIDRIVCIKDLGEICIPVSNLEIRIGYSSKLSTSVTLPYGGWNRGKPSNFGNLYYFWCMTDDMKICIAKGNKVLKWGAFGRQIMMYHNKAVTDEDFIIYKPPKVLFQVEVTKYG